MKGKKHTGEGRTGSVETEPEGRETESIITLAEHQELEKKKNKRVGERKEGPWANSSSPATINLWPKEIHNN